MWLWYYKKLIEEIDHYILRNYSKIFYWIILHMFMTDLLWPLHYILGDTDTTYTILHLSLDIATVYIIPWSWYKLYSLSDIDVLETDSWSCYTESHTFLRLHWLMKLTKLGLLRETIAGKILGGVLERTTPCGFGCHTWAYYLCMLLLLQVT